MKTQTTRILVVDDQFADLSVDFEKRCPGFGFEGVDSFDVDHMLSELARTAATVLLLDVIDAATRNPNAGIEFYKALQKEPRWQELRDQGHATQVVIFTSQPEHIHQFEAAAEKGTDLSGFASKVDLYSDARRHVFEESLRTADREARKYREFPFLADPIRAECELQFNPMTQSMRVVWEQILMAGRCWENVLIQGETGTGKEMVAKAIVTVMKSVFDGAGPKPPGFAGKMISYNIGSAPQEGNLQYTELFGATKGSFVGCDEARLGIFERGSKPEPGRTIFLDEIGDAPPIVQVALLRVLQENKVIPLGGFAKEGAEIERSVSFRLITASHRDLDYRVAKGEFRNDLYYRLNTLEIHVPPLRDRLDDIPVLVPYFLKKLNKKFEEYGLNTKKVILPENQEDIYAKLKSYSWPGNVRELESFIRRSYVLSLGSEFVLSDDIEELINGRQLPARVGGWAKDAAREVKTALIDNPIRLADIRKEYGRLVATKVAKLVIEEECGGSLPTKELAAKWFGMKYDACKRWMNDHGIHVQGSRVS